MIDFLHCEVYLSDARRVFCLKDLGWRFGILKMFFKIKDGINVIDNKKGALIAMSGGVDSSVAACLMVKQGYHCMGTTMRLYRNSDIGLGSYHTCCTSKDIEDASQVAFELGMPYEVLDFTFDFKKQIIDKFVRTYESGGVPNPCIDCNRYMKFNHLFDFADVHDLYYVVTGHYARTTYDPNRQRYLLKKAVDLSKDQSYVLYMLTQKQLERLKFPLGGITKEETREIADKLKLSNAQKRDSQDICFVADGDYIDFMEKYTGKKYPDGPIIDESGNLLGTHHGAVRYTTGQRKGLGIAATNPLYVIGKDMESNTVFAGPESSLYDDTLCADDMNWISIEPPTEPFRVKAKTRYRQIEQWATVFPDRSDRIKLVFDEPQRAITIGQAVVLYDDDIVVGGGTIIDVFDTQDR